jgi:hypothetical protein
MDTFKDRELTPDDVARVREFMEADKIDGIPTSEVFMAMSLELPYSSVKRFLKRYCLEMEKGNPQINNSTSLVSSPRNEALRGNY